MNFVIGIDIGTTHCKAIAMDEQGNILHQLQTGFATINTSPGQSEQDPGLIFDTTINLLSQLLESLDSSELLAVSFSSAMHSVIAVDASGIPLTNAFTWADSRSEEYAKELIGKGIAQKLYPSNGVPMHPMLPLCKIIWIKNTMRTIFALAKKFISIKEYIFFRLFGKYVVDHSIAASTGMLDVNNLEWNKDALNVAGISSNQLSAIVPVTHSEKDLKKEFRDKLQLTTSIPFVIGSSDGCLANIGSGAIRKGDAAVTVGTSGAIRLITELPTVDPQQRLFSYPVTENFFVTGGPINNGGIAVKWFAENFLQRQFSSNDDFNWYMDQIENVPPGSDGLIFLPYLLGERAPHWDAKAKGMFFGLTFSHHREHMMRSIVEGISFALKDVMRAVSETNGNIERLYASGGFVHSKAWLQLLADVLGKKITVSTTGDASATGAAMLAFYVIRNMKDWEQFKNTIVTRAMYEPDMENHKLYEKQFQIYQSLYPKTKDLCN